MVAKSKWLDESAGVSMRVLLLIFSLLLILADGAASAQSGSRLGGATPSPTGPTPPTPKAGSTPDGAKSAAQKLGAEYMAQCMNDWDAATHMTKQEWERTCRRVVEGRVKFLLEQKQ